MAEHRTPAMILRRGYKIMNYLNIHCFTALRRILPLVLFCAIFFHLSTARAESDKITVYFYSSESNINNFKLLKMEFDSYFSGFGNYEFQPFNDRKAFENHVRDRKECLLLLSSWHYSIIHREYSLKPALIGTRNGKKYQKRVLVGKGRFADMEIAKTGLIASASSIQHTRSTLTDIFGEKAAADTAKILTVPKDVDALMSVGFGMSQSALTTSSSLDRLKNLNPVLHQKMKIIAEGRESLMLVAAFPESLGQHAEEIVNIIRNMPENPDGRKRVNMLGLDGWEKPDLSVQSKLER